MRCLLISLITVALSLQAQAQLAHAFRQKFTDKPFRKDAEGVYYRDGESRVVFLGTTDSLYQVYNAKNELLEQGKYTITGADSIGRSGLCTELYSYSKAKAAGNYNRNMPVGEWHTYYPNGRPAAKYTIKLHGRYAYYAGSYDEFYENGSQKVRGNYAMTFNEDSVSERHQPAMPQTGAEWAIFLQKYSDKVGMWYYFNDKGEQEREEEY